MNQHLNVFRYFNENEGPEFIENNLSRAFAICLRNDALFFSQYINALTVNDDYEYLFSYYEKKSAYRVDLQVNTNNIELTDIKKVYAVAMTGHHSLDMGEFMGLKASNKGTNLTDVCILIKDIAFVIEVKRGNEDCRQQLFDQIFPFLEQKIEVVPLKFSWIDTIKIMEQVSNIHKFSNSPSYFIEDFLALSEIRYSHWFSSKSFHLLPDLNNNTTKTTHLRYSRLKQIISHSDYEVLPYNDRMAISVPFGWASEVIPSFITSHDTDYLILTTWPGNTKGQGQRLYNKSLKWVEKCEMIVESKAYKLDVSYHMKFSHFNRYVTSLNFTDSDLNFSVNTNENFNHNSGKWNINDWGQFENFMDEHFKTEFDWRSISGWSNNFRETDRTYFTVAFGYEVDLYVPYKDLQDFDRIINDYSKPSHFINCLINSFSDLIN